MPSRFELENKGFADHELKGVEKLPIPVLINYDFSNACYGQKSRKEWSIMINTKYTTLTVHQDNYDDRICLRIEDDEQFGGILNLIWMTTKETKKLINELQKKVEELETRRQRIDEIIQKTDFHSLYAQFERRYNKYPVEMSAGEAFGKAFAEGLIDQDTYDAAYKVYRRLWNYVGD